MQDYKLPGHFSDASPRMKKLFIIIPLAIAGVAVLFILFGFLRTAPPMAMPPQAVILGAVESREINTSTEYVGRLEAEQSVILQPRVSGYLQSKNFADGDMVKKGQVLFQIEPDQYQALVEAAEGAALSAQAQLDKASLNFTRIRDLYNKRTSPKSDYDSSKADFEVAQAAVMSAQASLKEARLNLGYASILAPFDGRISDTPFSVGAFLSPEIGPLAQVVSLDPIQVVFGVSDKVIASLRGSSLNQDNADQWQVRLRFSNGAIYEEAGKLSYVAPVVNPQTDTVGFKAKFNNPGNLLAPNQIVTAILEKVNPARRLIVPKEAVLTDTDGNFVYLPKQAENGFVSEMRRVKTDGELDREYIIAEGLSEGEKIIVRGLMSGGATLAAGAPIQIVPEEGAEGASPIAGEGK